MLQNRSYQHLVQHIFSLSRFGIKPGLERIRPLLNALGNPQDAFRTIHVAGTNGKGSTSSFLASILQAGGYSVGLFTSPHLCRFTERFRVNGREIVPGQLVGVAERVCAAAPPDTTFFEIATALAILWFAEEGIDLAVLEVGMGGRFDSTNAVDGLLSVITPVSLDHCRYLGDTVAAIAAEKCGILRAGKPVVVGAQQDEAVAVIVSAAQAMETPLYRYEHDFKSRWDGPFLSYSGITGNLDSLLPGIGGRYQSGNVACALAAAELLDRTGIAVSTEAMRTGIMSARWPGRMETLDEKPAILLDGAHNPAGAAALARELTQIPHARLLLVTGIMGDKDVVGILEPLLGMATECITVTPALERSLDGEQLAAQVQELGYAARCGGSVAEGLTLARSVATPDDLIVVCGSLFVVGEARAFLTGESCEQVRG